MTYRNLHRLLFLLPLACEPAQPHGFQVEGDVTPIQIYAAQEAIDEWCSYGYCAWLGDGTSIFRMVDSMPPELPYTIGLHERNASDNQSSRISILRGWNTRKIMLHELGHHWGCREDLEGPGFVMSAWEDEQPPHLTDGDLDCVAGK